MRKLLNIILWIIVCLSLAACGAKSEELSVEVIEEKLFQEHKDTAIIVLSVNPMFELYVDADGIVFKVEGANDEAAKLLEGKSPEGTTLSRCVEDLLSLLQNGGYLKASSQVKARVYVRWDNSNLTDFVTEIAETIADYGDRCGITLNQDVAIEILEKEAETETEGNGSSGQEEGIPDDVQEGDILYDGSVYLENVDFGDKAALETLRDRYRKPGLEIVWYTTPTYTGFVELTEDGILFGLKRNASFQETVMYYPEGMVSTDREEYDENGALKFSTSYGTEADYRVDTYYNANGKTVKHVKLENEEVIRHTEYEIIDPQAEQKAYVETYIAWRGYQQRYTYADKAARILKTMTVIEPDGLTYTHTLDGKGNEMDNVISLEVTEGGKTATYQKGSIPWWKGYVAPPGYLR